MLEQTVVALGRKGYLRKFLHHILNWHLLSNMTQLKINIRTDHLTFLFSSLEAYFRY
jgi:hypothetical protein